MKKFSLLTTAALCAFTQSALAEISGDVVRLGVLTDMSGIFAAAAGPGSVLAAKMAAEDFGGKVNGKPIEVIFADHLNKTDTAVSIAREWIDQKGVDAILDVPNSSVALAVAEIGRQKSRAVLFSTAGTSALTGKNCAPTTVHWTFDTNALANSGARGMLKAGGKRWFTIGADSAFGTDMEAKIRKIVQDNGAQFVGAIRHPYGIADFSSFLLQAQAAKADVIAFLSGGQDTATAVKQAQEYGVDKAGIRLLTPTVTISEVHGLGLAAARGLFVSEPFYWDLNEGTRAFSKRFSARHNGAMPTMIHAGVYAATLHYLKAVAAANSDDGATAVAKMKDLPTDDPLFGKGRVRVDGRKMHNYYLFQVKTPDESKYAWDYYKTLQTISAEESFLPLKDSECSLVKH